MKILSLVLGFCLLTTFAFADVKAKVLDIKILDRDYIWIEIEYDIDGKKVINSYPMDFQNTAGKTNQEILNWIDVNIKYQCDRYIEAEFRKKANDTIIKDKLQTLINKQVTKDSADLLFDTDNDGTPDIKWVIKQDGTYIETPLP